MAYGTVAALKQELGKSDSDDDERLQDLLDVVTVLVEARTGRLFQATQDSTRNFDAVRDVQGRLLVLDEDLCAITSVTNGNGTVLTASDYVTEPRNKAPYWGLRLKASSAQSWTYTGAPEDAIAIVGRWAYSQTPDAAIVQMTVRWAAYLYRLPDAGVFDVTAIPETGEITIPQGIPRDVRLVLDRPPYKRVGI